MKKRNIFRTIVGLILVITMACVAMIPVAAAKNGPAGKSSVGHLYLYEKDPVSWDIIEDGAWGKMTYRTVGPTIDIVFNGHGLVSGTDYTLIYYPDPWPGEGLISLGSGTATIDGSVHIKAEPVTGNLLNAKIWLVLASDVGDSSMAGWHPTEYLFEYDLIDYTETP